MNRFDFFLWQVNQIRYSLDTLLFASDDNTQCNTIPPEHRFATMTKLKEATLK